MPVITNPPSPQNQHVRNTVTFVAGTTGTAAAHTIFTLTGTVIIRLFTAVVTSDLTSSGSATLALGYTGTATAWSGGTIAYTEFTTTNNIWTGAGNPANSGVSIVTDVALNGANIIYTVGTAALTGGVLVFDLFYDAVSDDGALA